MRIINWMAISTVMTIMAVAQPPRQASGHSFALASASLRVTNGMPHDHVTLGVNETVVLRDVGAGQTTGYVAVPDSAVQLKLFAPGTDSVTVTLAATFAAGRHYTATVQPGPDGRATLAVQADSIP